MPRIMGYSNQDYPPTKSDSGEGERIIQDGQVGRKFREIYPVLGDSVNDTDDIILGTTPGLPGVGDTKRGCVCEAVKATEINTAALQWEVEARWTSKPAGSLDGENQPPPDPVDWTPTWEWDGEMEDILVEVDPISGKPLLNSSKEPILGTFPQPLPILRITRYQRTFDPNVNYQYVGRMNSAPFWGAPARTGLMLPIHDRGVTLKLPTYPQGIKVREVTYSIKFRIIDLPGQPIVFWSEDFDSLSSYEDLYVVASMGWRGIYLDSGTRHKIHGLSENEASGQDVNAYVPFKDKDQKDTTGNLDGFGFPLSTWGDDVPPVYLGYNRCSETDFNDLQLGPWDYPNATPNR